MTTNSALNMGQLSSGQIYIGNSSSLPSISNITPFNGMTCSNNSNNINIFNNPDCLNIVTLNNVSTTTTLSSNTKYITNNISGTNFKLPANGTRQLGDIVTILDVFGSGGFTVVKNTTDQNFFLVSTFTSAGGFIQGGGATNATVTLVLLHINPDYWICTDLIGELTIT